MSFLSSRVLCSIIALAATTPAAISGQQNDAAFRQVMVRVHEYVTQYEDHQLSTVLGRERYQQQELDAFGTLLFERVLQSDYLLFQLPDEDWVAVRDVQTVDGAAMNSESDNMRALFDGPSDRLGQRAMQMAEAAARFNLGPEYYRTVNLPTFALRMLRPAHRSRMVFSKAGEEMVEGTATWVVAVEETKGPTFSATQSGKDVPARGRFWVDPETGAVVRSEMILGGTRALPSRATVEVTYRRDARLGFRLPAEMRERYDNPRKTRANVVVAVATYSEFRLFDWRLR